MKTKLSKRDAFIGLGIAHALTFACLVAGIFPELMLKLFAIYAGMLISLYVVE